VIVPHYANEGEPHHFQAPFQFIDQPDDWNKLKVYPSFAGMSLSKKNYFKVNGIDEDFDYAMGFADLDFGIRLWQAGCNVMLVDGITCFIDDKESGGSLREQFVHTLGQRHRNGQLLKEKWPHDYHKYGID
jgi:GT2 family glycosyltransferase